MDAGPGLLLDELHAEIFLRLQRCPARAPKALRFVDEACGHDLAHIIPFERLDKEVRRHAHKESLAIYGRNFVSCWQGILEKMLAAKDAASWDLLKDEVVALIAAEPSAEEASEGASVGLPAGCSEEEAVASLVQCGIEAAKPSHKAAVGFLLASFGDIKEENLVTVVENGGVALMPAALAEAGGARDLQTPALDFLVLAVDPNGSHAGEVRDAVAHFAAGDGGLIPAVIAAMKSESGKAVAVLAGLVRADRALAANVREANGCAALFDVLEQHASDAKFQAQTLDIMGGLLDASVGASMAAYALRAARAFPGNLKVQMSSCNLLHACVSHMTPAALLDLDCGAAIASCMKLCKAVPNVQRVACGVLRALADAGHWCLDGPGAASICAVVAAAMQKFGKVPGLLDDSLAVLTAVAKMGGAAQDAARDCADAVGAAVAAHVRAEDNGLEASAQALLRLLR